MNRKILSIKSKTSCLASSRKYSAMVRAACPTRKRAPGGSFIWPKTMMVLSRTPASAMARYSSSPSRHLSPMPQKMLMPCCRPTVLWISSVISTVFPTPAPPNNPPLPPRSRGASTSMALMPVAKISETTVRWVKGMDGWWMERHSPPKIFSFSSITAPKTLNIRPRSLCPTGTFRWWPRSSTVEPRANP